MNTVPTWPAAIAIGNVLVGGSVFTWLLRTGHLTPITYLAAVVLVFAFSIYLVGPPQWFRSDSKPSTDPKTTARIIAFALIGVFGSSLLLTAAIAAYEGSSTNNGWLEVFKSGFLLLGGGLTSVIGYYFGSRVNPAPSRKNQDTEADPAPDEEDTDTGQVGGLSDLSSRSVPPPKAVPESKSER